MPRGGALPVALDQKTAATVGLAYLAGHCVLDIVKPSKVVEGYGLDASQEINSFYLSRVGGWGLAAVGSLLLQLYTDISFGKAIGYSLLPIAVLTLYQLLTGKYEKAGVNQNSGIVDIFFQTIHCAIMLVGEKVPPSTLKLWTQTYMALIGLSGLNLVISAQTIPGIGPSTTTILRMLGTVSCYMAASILSQESFDFIPLKAVGVLMATLAVTSIPVCMDLHTVATKSSTSTSAPLATPVQLYTIYMLLEIGIAAYMFR